MLEIIKQLALDAAEKGADFCVGTVTKAAPLTIRLEEGLELTEAFLVLTEDVLQAEETGRSKNRCRRRLLPSFPSKSPTAAQTAPFSPAASLHLFSSAAISISITAQQNILSGVVISAQSFGRMPYLRRA